MKDWNIKKWTLRFITLALTIMFYDAIMGAIDKIIEQIHENKSYINEEIDIESIISMKDLGFEFHKTEDSRIKELDPRIDPDGDVYFLTMNNDDVNHSVWIDIQLYNFSTREIALESFESIVRVIYRNDKTMTVECRFGTSSCAMPNLSYEDTIEHMFLVDEKNWNVEKGYSLIETFTDEYNTVVLLKGQQVMVFEYSSNSTLTQSCIPTIVNLFDQSEKIFK